MDEFELYHELELAPGEIYKGFLNERKDELVGKCIYTKKDKYVVVGQITDGQFFGLGVVLDLCE